MTRLHVQSADGTSLAVRVEGAGPALVLVHGSFTDHTTFDAIVEEFRGEMTTFAMDRRGYGASSDAGPYAIEREFEDVAAVVEATAARTGGPVVLFGHSYGAGCALGGAVLTNRLSHLVLYEPGLGIAYSRAQLEAIEEALAADDTEAATRLVLGEIVGLSEADIEDLRATPRWPVLLAGAPLVLRESKLEDGWVYHPGQFDMVTVPALLLSGDASPSALRTATQQAAAALPHAEVRVLAGHAHLAHRNDPAVVAATIRQFVSS